MPGGKIVYVPLHPPATGATKTSSAADWTIDFDELEKAITPRSKMIVINTPREYSFPSRETLVVTDALKTTLWVRYSLKRSCSGSQISA